MDHFRIGGRRQVAAGTPSPALFDLPVFGPTLRCSSPKRGLSFCCGPSDDSTPSRSQGLLICRSSFVRRLESYRRSSSLSRPWSISSLPSYTRASFFARCPSHPPYASLRRGSPPVRPSSVTSLQPCAPQRLAPPILSSGLLSFTSLPVVTSPVLCTGPSLQTRAVPWALLVSQTPLPRTNHVSQTHEHGRFHPREGPAHV